MGRAWRWIQVTSWGLIVFGTVLLVLALFTQGVRSCG